MQSDPDLTSATTAVQVVEAGEVTHHNRALLEAGKTLLLESVQAGRDFCKFMIGASVGAIPVYIGLLEFILPDGYQPRPCLIVLPNIFFLAAAVSFAFGYLPRTSKFSLDIPDEIEMARSEFISHRRRFAIIGFTLYAVGLLFGGIITTIPIGLTQQQVSASGDLSNSA